MISKADDFPIHQLPSPIAEVGTERNINERYIFKVIRRASRDEGDDVLDEQVEQVEQVEQ